MRTDIAWSFRLYQGVPILWHLAQRSKTKWIGDAFRYTAKDIKNSNFLEFDFSINYYDGIDGLKLKFKPGLHFEDKVGNAIRPSLTKVKGFAKRTPMNPERARF